MRYVITAQEVAKNALIHAIGVAIRDLETGIKNCGELSSKDAKQSEASKVYFADQALVYAEAVQMLAGWRDAAGSREPFA